MATRRPKRPAKQPAAKQRPAARKQRPAARKQPTAKPRPAARKQPTAKPRPAARKQPTAKPRPAARKQPTAKPRPAAKPRPSAKTRAQRPRAELSVPIAAAVVAPDWRAALRAEVVRTGEDFAAYLRGLGATGWEFADHPELAGLEAWGTELARRDRFAGIGALVRVAQHGFPIAMAAGGIGLEGMGFLASEPAVDGAPVETQIARAAAWLDAPDAAHFAAVVAGIDPSRQLQIWDDDLRPSDERAHWWYADVGQCCGHAITRTGGDARLHSYYEWPPETCVGRGLVVAVRGVRAKGTDLRALLADVRAAMVA